MQGARALGIDLDPETVTRFARYQGLLHQWGARISLTSVRDPLEVVTHHFLDSLALLTQLPAGPPPVALIDVGAGAGFPGAVCALLRPGWEVTLVERTQKKAAFLLTVRRELGLTLRVLAEDIGTVRERFQVVVSRAAFPPPLWLQVGQRLVAEGGLLLAMVTPREGDLTPPAGFADEIDHVYDVGAGPRRIRGWRRVTGTY